MLSLPALFAVLGHRVNSLRIGRHREQRPEHEGMWHRLSTLVMRRPVPIALSVVAILLLLGAPFLRVRFGTPDDRVLPESAGSRQASEILRSEFSGNSAESFGVVIDGVDTTDPTQLAEARPPAPSPRSLGPWRGRRLACGAPARRTPTRAGRRLISGRTR